MNTKEKIILGVLGLLILAIVAISFLKEKPAEELVLNSCGNGVCDLSESCSSCQADCGCRSGEYCDTAGVCTIPTCGDGQCSDEEKVAGCCEDCGGCSETSFCNKGTHQCTQKAAIPEADLKEIAEGYLAENGESGKVGGITDNFYNGKVVKVVFIDQTTEGSSFASGKYLFISEDGTVIGEDALGG